MGNAIICLFLATLLLLSFHFCYWVLLSCCRCLFWGETFFIKPLVIFMWLLPRLLIAFPLLFIPFPPFFNLVFANFTHKMQNDVQQPPGDFCSCCVHYVFFWRSHIWKPMDPSAESPEAAVMLAFCHLSPQMQPLHAPSVALWLPPAAVPSLTGKTRTSLIYPNFINIIFVNEKTPSVYACVFLALMTQLSLSGCQTIPLTGALKDNWKFRANTSLGGQVLR